MVRDKKNNDLVESYSQKRLVLICNNSGIALRKTHLEKWYELQV